MSVNAPALALGLGVAASLGASVLSGVATGTSIGAVSAERRLDITPRSGAFSIWGPIYTLLVASVVYAARQPVPLTPAVLVAAAEALSAVWVGLFLTNTPASLVAAAVALIAAAAAGVWATVSAGPLSLAAPWTRTLCVDVSFGLFAGWLCCAAVLGVGIALRAYGAATPRWVLLVLAALVATAAVVGRNPVLALPCAWALAWQTRITSTEAAGIVLCVGGAAGALLR